MDRQSILDKLVNMKQAGEKIASLTAYDASFARLQEQAGVDVILVGDSLGMVLHGEDTTLKVSMDDMIYHTQIVSRVVKKSILISDMPYMSYETTGQCLSNARRLVDDGGAQIVKLEGGEEKAEMISAITNEEMSVCGHLGLLPQSIEKLGGYNVQARNEHEAEKLKKDAMVLQQAGAVCLVLECIPANLAAEVSEMLDIPTIGIGAGVDCDGQVLVVYDMLGITEKEFKFSKNFLASESSVKDALKSYVSSVKNKTFPANEHSY